MFHHEIFGHNNISHAASVLLYKCFSTKAKHDKWVPLQSYRNTEQMFQVTNLNWGTSIRSLEQSLQQ